MVSDFERLQLGWLARQRRPMWGGHIERDEPLDMGSDIYRWLQTGLIERGQCMRERQKIRGYVITDKGRELIARL